MRNVYRYIRVSTDQQAEHGYSLEAQDQVLSDYAAGHKLRIVESFVESESAFTTGKRPEFTRMCEALRSHPGVNAVLVYKFDRLARNMTDFALLTEDLGATLISMTEGEVSDTENQLLGGMHAVFARHYSQQLSQRVALGLKTKAQKGLWPTYAPTGYVNTSEGIEPDPVAGPLIAKLFELYAHTELSVAEVGAWVRAAGLRSRYGGKIYKSAVHKILQNPVYYGALPWKGETYEGKHEPLISREMWQMVQSKLHGRTSPRVRRDEFPFRGLLICAYCGCQITASLIKHHYVYYHCTRSKGRCEQPFHRAEVLSERLRCVVDKIHVPSAAVKSTLRAQEAALKDQERMRKARLIQLKAEARRISELRNAAYMDKIQQIIESRQWAEVDRDLAERGDVVAVEIERMSAARALVDVSGIFKLLERAPVWYNRQSDEQRARLLKVLASNCVLSAENIRPNYRYPFDEVAVAVETGDWLGVMDVVQTRAWIVEPAAKLVLA